MVAGRVDLPRDWERMKRKEGPSIFIHGLESSNKGRKALFFQERYPEMIIPHFKGDLSERMAALESILKGRSGIKIVGSSFGGLMATLFTLRHPHRVERMILLAPAIHLMEKGPEEQGGVKVPTTIVHGTRDEVIPLEKVERAAKRLFSSLTFHRVEDDHLLRGTFGTLDWESLLFG